MSFKTFLEQQQQLNEKLIVLNHGKKYGQIVFLAGGASSGKNFAISNFLESEKFKIFDQDDLIDLFLKLERKTNGKFKDLNLKNSKDVTTLYNIVRFEKNWKNKILELLLSDLKDGIYPNIIFNTTLSDPKMLIKYIEKMEQLGYHKKDMHLIWVLSDYTVAVERNSERGRVVGIDILLDTHVGATKNLSSLLIKNRENYPMDGGAYVILNNKENTIYYDNNDKTLTTPKIKSFKYLTLKKPGKKMENKEELFNQLKSWIIDNSPKTQEMKDLFEGNISNLSKKFNRKLSLQIPTIGKFQVENIFPINVDDVNIEVDIIADIQDTVSQAVFRKNNKSFLAELNILATQPDEWIKKLKQDYQFLSFLKDISEKI